MDMSQGIEELEVPLRASPNGGGGIKSEVYAYIYTFIYYSFIFIFFIYSYLLIYSFIYLLTY